MATPGSSFSQRESGAGADTLLPTVTVGGMEFPVVVLADADGQLSEDAGLESISFNESVAAPLAATWYVKRRWSPPANTRFRPRFAQSIVTTAGSRTMIVIGCKLGELNLGTNVFTDAGVAAAPRHYSRLFGIVSTVLSATADTITVTYTNEAGTAARATAAAAFPASLPVGHAVEFTLQATIGQERDAGVRDVTAIADTAATTGIVEIWGFNVLHDAFGLASTNEITNVDDVSVSSAETIMILLQQAAVTAQQRGATVSGSVR